MAISPGILKLARNKYLMSLVGFVVWMSFFDPKDWQLIYARKQKLKELQESEGRLNKQIAQTRSELYQLKTSALTIEKYARERYYMKKDNEDLFVIPENQEK
ncbi:MAG TPA: septum formation initiator family protein [Ferruginibacter sp.]|nr:septum formation initiator family protein [Ferruginibacter sp.]